MTKHTWLLLTLVAPVALTAQEPAPVSLRPTDATLKDTAGEFRLVRELADGRVLARGSRRVVVADFKTGKIQEIPDLKPGTPEMFVGLAGDSTLMPSMGGWVFLDGTRVIGMLPGTNPVVAAALHLRGADRGGFAVATGGSVGDSVDVVRVERTSGATAIVARIRLHPGTASGEQAPAYWASESVLVAPDGWIAVLRLQPYRVDWRSPDGQWVLGKPIKVAPIAMDDREKAAYDTLMARGTYRPPAGVTPRWPPFVEPVAAVQPFATIPSTLVSLDGKLLVSRTPTADFPYPRYDVVNRQGDVERQIKLDSDAAIVGFGTKSVYVRVAVGRTGTLLERHPWP